MTIYIYIKISIHLNDSLLQVFVQHEHQTGMDSHLGHPRLYTFEEAFDPLFLYDLLHHLQGRHLLTLLPNLHVQSCSNLLTCLHLIQG